MLSTLSPNFPLRYQPTPMPTPTKKRVDRFFVRKYTAARPAATIATDNTFVFVISIIKLFVQLINNMEKELSIGEKRVRITFNPSAEGIVDRIKNLSAELIDLCETLKPKDARLASLAQTEYELAAMWAVKAATATVNTTPQMANGAGPVTETSGVPK